MIRFLRSLKLGVAPKGAAKAKHVAKCHRVNNRFVKCDCRFLGLRKN